MQLGVKTTRARQVRGPGGHARVPARSGLARSPTGALTLRLVAIAISTAERHGESLDRSDNARIYADVRTVKRQFCIFRLRRCHFYVVRVPFVQCVTQMVALILALT